MLGVILRMTLLNKICLIHKPYKIYFFISKLYFKKNIFNRVKQTKKKSYNSTKTT